MRNGKQRSKAYAGRSSTEERAPLTERRVSRRSFVKTGVIGSGALLGWLYVAPSLRSIGVAPAYAQSTPTRGSCTPGFWKNHLGDFPCAPYCPGTAYDSIFIVPGIYTASLGGAKTLQTVLGQGGGCEFALGRHSAAALLNAQTLGEAVFGLSPASVISMTNTALGSGICSTIENLKDTFDGLNNDGCLDGALVADD